MKNVIIFFAMILFMYSCHKDRRYETGHFTESVVNFSDVNSEYDDYDSTEPFIYNHYLFHFSSNRKSLGKDFDIVGEKMFIDWSKTSGTLKIGTNVSDDRFDYLMPMFDSINTSCNELGPFSLGFRQDIEVAPLFDKYKPARSYKVEFEVAQVSRPALANVGISIDCDQEILKQAHDKFLLKQRS